VGDQNRDNISFLSPPLPFVDAICVEGINNIIHVSSEINRIGPEHRTLSDLLSVLRGSTYMSNSYLQNQIVNPRETPKDRRVAKTHATHYSSGTDGKHYNLVDSADEGK
jgi:hypothetical protein